MEREINYLHLMSLAENHPSIRNLIELSVFFAIAGVLSNIGSSTETSLSSASAKVSIIYIIYVRLFTVYNILLSFLDL